MSAKMVAIGARVPQEDAEFISQLKIEGATTPSDKVRVIIAEARRRHQGSNNYDASLDMVNGLLTVTNRMLRHAEMESKSHSELMARTLDWLPDMMAYLLSSRQKLADGDLTEMKSLEEDVADRVFRLVESVLQMGVTRHCTCYDKNLITQRVAPILDLARVIQVARVNLDEGE
ncbi:MAG: hypothetical protein OEU50_23050 [Gammaproteobacteria bacterium]|nr:hypothetical protein [Gammaproteobacteria bacterium]